MLLLAMVFSFSLSLHADEKRIFTHGEMAHEPSHLQNFGSDREMLFNRLLAQLPKSSQRQNAGCIQPVIEQLWNLGVCELEGNDEEIRPACIGLQCLFEEMFPANRDLFERADFEIHTTMPSTPCCKLPHEKAREIFLASFEDEDRLVTIDGRSVSLNAIMQPTQCHFTPDLY